MVRGTGWRLIQPKHLHEDQVLRVCVAQRNGSPPPPRPPLVQATPVSKQHEALVPSSFARWILAVQFFNRSYCVVRVLCDTGGLRCTMFIFCVKEADGGMMAFVSYFALWFSE